MNPFYIITALASLVAAVFGGAAVVDHEHSAPIFVNDEIIKGIQSNAGSINNAVQNMLAGYANPADVQYEIQLSYRDALHDTDYSKDEVQENENYKDYLNAAYTVTQDKISGSSDLEKDVGIMNDKYNSI